MSSLNPEKTKEMHELKPDIRGRIKSFDIAWLQHVNYCLRFWWLSVLSSLQTGSIRILSKVNELTNFISQVMCGPITDVYRIVVDMQDIAMENKHTITCCSQPSSHAFCPLDWGCVGSSCWLCSSESLTHFNTSMRAKYKWLDLDSAIHKFGPSTDIDWEMYIIHWRYLDGNSGSLSHSGMFVNVTLTNSPCES